MIAVLQWVPSRSNALVTAIPGRGPRKDVSTLVVDAGLCATCEYTRRITNRRGSEFLLCGLAATDRNYARYPALPVVRCPGFADRNGNDSNNNPTSEKE